MLPRDCLAIQFTSFDELVDSTLWGGVEVAHDHAQGIAIALAHNVVHDIQQRPQLGNLHAKKEHQDVQHYVMHDIQQRPQLESACREGKSGCAALCQVLWCLMRHNP